MRVLNLYAGIGGNRKKWIDVDVTAVEIEEEIANIYKSLYPNDTIIIGDAHQYLLNNSDKFDFVWTSTPCQTHSSMRQNLAVRFRGTRPMYADMRLYQEIIFLKYNFKGLWVVENVKPYYEPLIKPTVILQRHLFWANFEIENLNFPTDNLRSAQISDLQEHIGINLSKYKLSNKRRVLRNCVHPDLGQHIMLSALNSL